MVTHSIHLLTGAFVADALDATETRAFEEHLENCGDCQEEVAGMREVAAMLADSFARTAPDVVRRQVLANIAAVRPRPPVVSSQVRTVTTLDDRRGARAVRSRRVRLAALAAAAAVLTAIGAGAVVAGPGNDSGTVVSASAQVLHAPDKKHSTVESDTGWAATVWHSDSVGKAVIITRNMPTPPSGLVYQLWLDQPSSGLVSAGVMPVAADQTVLLQGDAASANGAGITLEPEGGSVSPTSESIALFDFGQGA